MHLVCVSARPCVRSLEGFQWFALYRILIAVDTIQINNKMCTGRFQYHCAIIVGTRFSIHSTKINSFFSLSLDFYVELGFLFLSLSLAISMDDRVVCWIYLIHTENEMEREKAVVCVEWPKKYWMQSISSVFLNNILRFIWRSFQFLYARPTILSRTNHFIRMIHFQIYSLYAMKERCCVHDCT